MPRPRLSAGTLIACLTALTAYAQGSSSAVPAAQGNTITQVRNLPNGVELTSGPTLLRIVALRDDILRVRASHDGALGEDASWAVLPEKRAASVVVTPLKTEGDAGFSTRTIRVAVSLQSGELTVRRANDTIVLQESLPVAFTSGGFQLTETMPVDEHYFGLGDKTGPLDRRGHAFTMWNTDAYRFQESTDPLYKTIPFFLMFRKGQAAGVLLDSTWRSSFDFGERAPAAYTFGAEGDSVDYYILAGPTPRAVVESYAWLTGAAPLPPRWMLGFQQSRYTYTPASRLMEVAERLRTDRIPTDALYLDIDFQDRNRPFTVDTTTFPDLKGTLAKLSAMHFHTVAITDLHIASAPGQSYAPYDGGIAGNRFLRQPNGSLYVGSVWPGPAVFPDFTQAATRAWWGTLYAPFAAMGFEGFWNDMNEPSIFDSPTGTMPLDTLHRIEEPGFRTRTATHAEIHNVYGMENSRATYEGLLKLQPDQRPFVLTRATYAGGQRYAATWTGDNSSTWNHLRMTAPMLKSLGLGGFSFSGADVGGFAGTATSELLTKWIEVAAFHPIDRDHSEKGTGDQEPWVGGTAHEDIRRRFIEERYRLMPYLYTVAEESSRTGMPMLRPLFLDDPQATTDGHPIDIDAGVESEFLLGHDLLIAPPPYPEAPDAYTVEFPSPHWFNYWTGEVVPQPPQPLRTPNAPAAATDRISLYANVKPELATLPVFVRAGSILPIAPLTQSTDETPVGPLTLRVYAGDDCRGSLYTDDGKSFAYRRGEFLRLTFHCEVKSDALTLDLSPREGSFTPWWTQVRVEVYGWKPVAGLLTINDKQSSAAIQQAANAIVFTVSERKEGSRITLR